MEVEAAAESELRVLTHDNGHMGAAAESKWCELLGRKAASATRPPPTSLAPMGSTRGLSVALLDIRVLRGGRISRAHHSDAEVAHESAQTGVKIEIGGNLYMFGELGEQ